MTAENDPPTPASTMKKESIWEVYFPTGVRDDREAIPVASFPMIIYFWPSLFIFSACAILQALGWMSPQLLGLIAMASWTFNLLVIVTDLDQKKFLIAVLTVVLVGLGAWISSLKDMGVVSIIGSWIGRLDITFSTQAYVALTTVLFLLFFVGMLQPRFNYWRFESNEFVHYIQPWGRDQSVPRLGSTVTREVPDLLELILTFGGGTLVIRREGQVVARIEHVPFLGRRMIALERLLGSTRVKHVS